MPGRGSSVRGETQVALDTSSYKEKARIAVGRRNYGDAIDIYHDNAISHHGEH